MILVGCAALLTGLRADGLTITNSFTNSPEAVVGQKIFDASFDSGVGAPAVIIANANQKEAVIQAASMVPGVAQAPGSVCVEVDYAKLAKLPPAARTSIGPGCRPEALQVAEVDGRLPIDAIMNYRYDTAQAAKVVQDIRAAVHAVPGADAIVGGQAAIQYDTKKASEHDRDLIIPIVLGAILFVLALLLRAIFAPILLILTVVLSFAATLGVSAFVFNHIFGFDNADPAFALFAFVFLVALGIDYNIFLMTRVREETLKLGTRKGIVRGLAVTGGVITSAGLVLAATFAVLGVLPLVFLAEIGFAVAFGVLLDTILVRSILVPALAYDIGKAIWWPSRLASLTHDLRRLSLRLSLPASPTRPEARPGRLWITGDGSRRMRLACVAMGGAPWRLPGFVIGELLGSGDSSDVWAARIAATGERVALKRVALTEADALRAARTEAALLTALDHPHLVRLHALIPTPDAAVLVLDLADGGSLADMLARRSRLAVGEVVTALAPIGAALAYAHQHGVLHGDVTPGNVLFTSIGLPMLADLGVGRIVGDTVPVRCTPDYIDPSVARGCAPGPSSDVFMLGAVAMRALTGTPVWRGTTTAEILTDAAAGDLGHVRERLAILPRPVVAVLEQALAAEPERRCTAAEFALDLRHSAAPMPVELRAGRRWEGAREMGRAVAGQGSASARPPGAHRAMPRRRFGRTAVTDSGRPAFDRPGPAPATPGHEGALTHRVRAPDRPTLPPPPGRLRRFVDRASSAWAVRRSLRLAIIALAVGGIALGGGKLWSGRPSPADAAGQRTVTPLAAPNISARPSSLPSPADLLRRLDDLREQAFARRDVGLLTRVYVPGPLLDEDSARLRRLVPVGCALVGAHTQFGNVRASGPAAGHWNVRATARLAPSTLRCNGVVSGHAAGAGPTGLRIELAQVAGQYRIAGQQPG